MFSKKHNNLIIIIAIIGMLAGFTVYFTNNLGAQASYWTPFKKHMEFLGYACELKKEGKRLRCKTKKFYPDFTLKKQNSGILFTSYYISKQYAKQNRSAFLNFVNNLNVIASGPPGLEIMITHVVLVGILSIYITLRIMNYSILNIRKCKQWQK